MGSRAAATIAGARIGAPVNPRTASAAHHQLPALPPLTGHRDNLHVNHAGAPATGAILVAGSANQAHGNVPAASCHAGSAADS
ncbi:hypothetical protein SAMN06265360_114145 [Haloechinothrix alba]|uniref:Uncharacterized protein n=1 Tax=Haloechinothrix alba TaxID=664784 RepID=A0A238YC60_9PSEU|nr:hypothetical protein SAMN06265360_114145 [Haloechinothrix alba]